MHVRDFLVRDADRVAEILSSSSRLRYVLAQHYRVDLGEVTAIRVDGDNCKLDVFAGSRPLLRFKAMSVHDVLRKDPETGVMAVVFDPALAQAIYEIVEDFAR